MKKHLTKAAALSSVLLSSAALPGVAHTGSVLHPAVTEFTLQNGMRAVVIEDHRAPVVTHMLWYRVGAADEPPGKSGIAHFLEHLMFKGTEKIPAGAFSKIIAENGGQDNAFTSLDYTAYFQRVARDRLSLMMEMEADRMRNLRITDEQTASERDVVLEERSSRTDNNPSARFSEQFSAALYNNHPYGIPVIGWRHEIEALNREDALAFYRSFYAPDNATLVVAGDVTPEEVEALASEYYGNIEPSNIPEATRPQEPERVIASRFAMEDARVRQPMLQQAFHVPSYVTDDDGEAEALALLGQIMGGSNTSRLQQALTVDEEVAIQVGAYYRGMARDLTGFYFYGTPKDGVSLETMEQKISDEVHKLIHEGISDAELERAKRLMIASQIYAQDSGAGLARRYGAALTIGLTLEDIHNWPERIRKVKAEDIVAAAKKYLRPRTALTGYLMPAGKPEEDGQ